MKNQVNLKSNIMVCVTNRNTCERLIARGSELAASRSQLHIVHCVEEGQRFMNTLYEGDAIEYLFTAAQLYNAELTLLRDKDVEDSLVDYALSNDITVIVIGAGNDPKNQLSIRLQRRLPHVRFDVVGE